MTRRSGGYAAAVADVEVNKSNWQRRRQKNYARRTIVA